MPNIRGAGDQTQSFFHAKQALWPTPLALLLGLLWLFVTFRW